MANPNRPVVNAGLLYLNGLNISNNATTPDEKIDVAVGAARDSGNVNDIVLSEALTINCAVVGANGIDTGALGNSLLYHVYIIGDSTLNQDVAGLVSLASNSSPSLPFGYDMYRRIGTVRTDGTADLLVFDQRGYGQEKIMWYQASIATDITAGSSATFAAVDLSGSVPSTADVLIAKCSFTPTGADDPLELRCGDSAVDEGQAIETGSAAGVVKKCNLWCPIGATIASGVDYKVTGSAVAINVQGYVDIL
ncbi:hypothetical protein YTPLAS21_19130 [Candidatus Nitrosocosmicus sp.]|nr:hypothetical protein YTPLAS21_19130 [Candidatus Nitrosocosmicus sp.]